jgi:CRP-like cAMP-binding protein
MLRLYSRELKTLDKHLANLTISMESNNPANLYEIHSSYHLLKKKNQAGHALLQYVRWATQNAPQVPALAEARHKLQGPYSFYKPPDLTSNKCNLEAGDVLFVECEPGPNAYVVKSGSVMVSALAGNHEFILAVLGPGEIIGELSLLENLPHGATVVAREKTELLKLSRETFHEEAGEVILQKIFESLARRIWLAHQRLSILKVKQPSARLYFYLFSLILHRKLSRSGSINFNFGLEELCRMCGLLRIKRESISEFMNDHNIEIGKNSITIIEAATLEKKALSYKFRSGRELENLFL